MHKKLERFETKENRLSRQINSMNTVINDVKLIEDDLVSKEKQLEKKIDESKEKGQDRGGGWGSDHIEMHPLIPHLSPPKNMQETLKEIGDRIH